MAKRKSNKGLEAARKKMSLDFLQKSGIPAGAPSTKLLKQIQDHIAGGLNPPEAHYQALEEWRDMEYKIKSESIAKLEKEETKKIKQIEKEIESERKKAEKSRRSAEKLALSIAKKEATDAAKQSSVLKKQTKQETNQETEQQTSDNGLLNALSGQRKVIGSKDTDVEKSILGVGGEVSIRDKIQEFIDKNKKAFSKDDPAGRAAFELMEESVQLGEDALTASTSEAKLIYKKLNFIKELAKKTKGDQKGIADFLESQISPLTEKLKKEISFKEFLKNRAKSFIKKIPENLARKIPLVGGILGDFLQERREQKENLKKYSGVLGAVMTKGGRGRQGLDREGGKTTTKKSNERPFEGANTAEEISESEGPAAGMLENKKDHCCEGSLEILNLIHKDLQIIKNYLIKPDESDEEQELRDREDELEEPRYGMTHDTRAQPHDAKNIKEDKKSILGTIADWIDEALLAALGIKAFWPNIVKWTAPILATILDWLATSRIIAALITGGIYTVVAALGTAIGLGAAWLSLGAWDWIFDDNVQERFFEWDTWTLGDVDRENERTARISEELAGMYNRGKSPDFIAARMQDPRELPRLLREGRITKNQALEAVQYLNSSNPDAVDPDIIEKINNFDPHSVPISLVPDLGFLYDEGLDPDLQSLTIDEFPSIPLESNASTGSAQSVSLLKSIQNDTPPLTNTIDGTDLNQKENKFTLIPMSLTSGIHPTIIPRIGRAPPPPQKSFDRVESGTWTDENGTPYHRVPLQPDGTAPYWQFSEDDNWKPNMSVEEVEKYKKRSEDAGIGTERQWSTQSSTGSPGSPNIFENTAMLSSRPTSSSILDTQKRPAGNSSTSLTSNQNINNNSNGRPFQNTSSGSNKNQPNNISNNFATTNNTQVVYNNDDLRIRNSNSTARLMLEKIFVA